MNKRYLLIIVIVAIGAVCATIPYENAITVQPPEQKMNQYKSHLIDVPYINQKENYPSGCESVSTVMALWYLGIDISPETFIDHYMNMGAAPYEENGKLYATNPWEKFVGSPYNSNGYGCYAPVIVKALQSFLDLDKYNVQELHDISIEELCKQYIQNDIPVILWASIDMQPLKETYTWYDKETKKTLTWKSPMHCLLLTGYDQDYYYFNDPMRQKNMSYKKADVEKVYKDLYSQAVVIEKKI